MTNLNPLGHKTYKPMLSGNVDSKKVCLSCAEEEIERGENQQLFSKDFKKWYCRKHK